MTNFEKWQIVFASLTVVIASIAAGLLLWQNRIVSNQLQAFYKEVELQATQVNMQADYMNTDTYNRILSQLYNMGDCSDKIKIQNCEPEANIRIRELAVKSFIKMEEINATEKGLSRTESRIIDMSRINLEGANLGVVVTEIPIDFSNANLRNATFDVLTLRHGRFYKTDMAGAQFSHPFSGRKKSVLENCWISDAIFDQAKISDMEFIEASAVGSSYKNAKIVRTTFQGGHFGHADFTRAQFRECEFIDVNISSANFTDAVFKSVEFENIIYSPDTKFPKGFKQTYNSIENNIAMRCVVHNIGSGERPCTNVEDPLR